jgi:ribosomal protein L37E
MTVPSPGPAAATERAHVCDRCGERMDERKCKIICPTCGFFRDCSDP